MFCFFSGNENQWLLIVNYFRLSVLGSTALISFTYFIIRVHDCNSFWYIIKILLHWNCIWRLLSKQNNSRLTWNIKEADVFCCLVWHQWKRRVEVCELKLVYSSQCIVFSSKMRSVKEFMLACFWNLTWYFKIKTIMINIVWL